MKPGKVHRDYDALHIDHGKRKRDEFHAQKRKTMHQQMPAGDIDGVRQKKVMEMRSGLSQSEDRYEEKKKLNQQIDKHSEQEIRKPVDTKEQKKTDATIVKDITNQSQSLNQKGNTNKSFVVLPKGGNIQKLDTPAFVKKKNIPTDKSVISLAKGTLSIPAKDDSNSSQKQVGQITQSNKSLNSGINNVKNQNNKTNPPVKSQGGKLSLTPYVTNQLKRLKIEAIKVKTGISTSGTSVIPDLLSTAEEQKSAIDAEASKQLKAATLLFDQAIDRVHSASDNTTASVHQNKVNSVNKIRQNAGGALSLLNKGTQQKQAETVQAGNKFASNTDKTRDDLLQEVKNKTFAQTGKVSNTADSITTSYSNSERHDRIRIELSDMAAQTNSKIIESEKELEEKIISNSNDLSAKFRQEGIDLSQKIPDGKDGVIDDICSLRDNAIEEINNVSISSLDDFRKNATDLINQLTREKKKVLDQINAISKQGKSVIDTQLADAQQKINLNITNSASGIDNMVSEIESEIPVYPDKIAAEYVNSAITSLTQAEVTDKKNMPSFTGNVKKAFLSAKDKTTEALSKTYEDIVNLVNETPMVIETKGKELTDNITKSYVETVQKAQKGASEGVTKFFQGIDDSIKKATDEWQSEFNDGKKELREKADALLKTADESVTDTIQDMKDEAFKLNDEWEATYVARKALHILWGGIKKIASVIWTIVKWVVLIVVAIVAVIVAIIVLIALLPEEIGAVLGALLELIVDGLIWVGEFIVERIIPFLARRIVAIIIRIGGALLGAWGAYQIYQAFTRKDLSMRQVEELGGEGVMNIAFSLLSEWKTVSTLFKGSEEMQGLSRITKLCKGDAQLAKTFMNAAENSAQVERVLGKMSAYELQNFLLKTKNVNELERLLNLAKEDVSLLQQLLLKSENAAQLESMILKTGDAKVLGNILAKTDDLSQADRLLGRVGDGKQLERLLNEVGSGNNLDEVLSGLGSKTPKEIQSASFKSLEDELTQLTSDYQDLKPQITSSTEASQTVKTSSTVAKGSPRPKLKTSSGATIRNSKWAGQDNPLALKKGFTVPVKENGYPDFSDYLYMKEASLNGVATDYNTVEIELTGSYKGDFDAANTKAGFTKTPENYTWHHTENMGELQLIKTEAHDAARHSGGVQLYKGKFGSGYK